jgi:hypothetical protein
MYLTVAHSTPYSESRGTGANLRKGLECSSFEGSCGTGVYGHAADGISWDCVIRGNLCVRT